MKRIPITNYLTTNCTIVEAQTDMRSIYNVFAHFPNRFLPVVNGLQFIGVIFRDDFFQACIQHKEFDLYAEDLVSKEMVKLSTQNTIKDAKEVFDTAVFDMLPVIDSDGDLAGILFRSEIENACQSFQPAIWPRHSVLQRVMTLFTF